MAGLNIDPEWRMFRYPEPKMFGSRGIDISKFYGKRYRLEIDADIPINVKAALYDYRYVQEFAVILGYVYLIISNAEDHFRDQRFGILYSKLQIYHCDCGKYAPKTFDYDQLAKELWDGPRPELVSDIDLWDCYRKEQQSVMDRFKQVVDCYAQWDESWNQESLQALKIAFNNLLEVK